MTPAADAQKQPGPDAPESPSPCLPREWCWLWLLGLALVLAVSRQSLWIDEANTADISMAVSLQEAWRRLLAVSGSTVQMPLYLFCMWCWVKLFGNGEWALRAAGLIWLAPGLVAMASGFRQRRHRLALMLAAATSAFAWYYAGEARPYAMMLGAACLIFAALLRLGRDDLTERQQSRWLTGFLLGLLILCGSNLLGAIWAIAALAAALILVPWRRLAGFWKSAPLRLALTFLLLLLLAIYYLWTLSMGERASPVGRTDWKTVLFVFYEQLGLTGLGPGRLELREVGIGSLRPYVLPLAVYFVLTAILLVHGLKEAARLESAQRVRRLALAVALPALLLLGMACATHFRILGRHFAPLMPIWFSLLALGLAALWPREGWLGRPVVAAYLMLSLWSCLSVRFAIRHERDDYRDAARCAREALLQNQAVWWNADGACARYYALPLDKEGNGMNSALLINNPSAADLPRLKKPDIILASKPDIFDAEGALAEYLARNHYQVAGRLPAFTIWRD
jgi:hypothetical protein